MCDSHGVLIIDVRHGLVLSHYLVKWLSSIIVYFNYVDCLTDLGLLWLESIFWVEKLPPFHGKCVIFSMGTVRKCHDHWFSILFCFIHIADRWCVAYRCVLRYCDCLFLLKCPVEEMPGCPEMLTCRCCYFASKFFL